MDVSSAGNAGIQATRKWSSADNSPSPTSKEESLLSLPTDKLPDINWDSAGNVASSVGRGVHGLMRATTGAASLALHAPLVTLGPLLTPSAESASSAYEQAATGYALTTAPVAGALGYALASYFDFNTFGTIVTTLAAAGGGAFAVGSLVANGRNTESNLAQVAKIKQEVGQDSELSGEQNFGYALSQGYRSAIGNYYESGARIADGVVAFAGGLAGVKPTPR